jgi:pimeloyl-ACP methyl ester carboxylesterase
MHGSAVLVHGMWSSPDDWRWVSEGLRQHGVDVIAPDLPSHRSTSAGRASDVDEVRKAIESAASPVVLVGWSYGGSIISGAGVGADKVAHSGKGDGAQERRRRSSLSARPPWSGWRQRPGSFLARRQVPRGCIPAAT